MSVNPQPIPFSQRRVALSLGLPAIVTVILALVAGALQVVNQLALKGNPQWQGVIAVFLVFLVGIGVNPLTGAAFRTALHLPASALVAITALVSAAAGALQTVGMSPAAHAIVATVLTILAALGFGSSVSTVGSHVKAKV